MGKEATFNQFFIMYEELNDVSLKMKDKAKYLLKNTF